MAVLFAALLAYRRDEIPPGLNNDAAEEALRGVYLLEQHRYVPLAVGVVGTSAETGYLYLVAALARLIGHGTLTIHLVCWVFAVATLWLVWRVVQRVDDSIPPWVPLLLLGGSAWFLHYARSGLRTIAAPFFLIAFTLMLDEAERRRAARWKALLAGIVLGLSLYTYTSARILPIAFVVYAAVRLLRAREGRGALAGCCATLVLGCLLASIPNLVWFFRQPVEFLTRGSYVLYGGAMDKALHVIWTGLLPFYRPERYHELGGPAYFSDGVSAAFATHHPVGIMLAAALLLGVAAGRRWLDRPVVGYLAACWITATLTLGVAGPSLTRLLILLPVYVVLGSLGVRALMLKAPGARPAVAVVLAAAALYGIGGYLSGAGGPRDHYFSPAATPIGQAAAAEARAGRRVLCIVAKDASVVRFLTNDYRERISIVEFFRRAPDPNEIRLQEFKPDVILVEDGFYPVVSRMLPWPAGTERKESYMSIRLNASR